MIRGITVMLGIASLIGCGAETPMNRQPKQASLRMLRVANIADSYSRRNDLVVLFIADGHWRAFYRDQVVDFEYSGTVDAPPAEPIANKLTQSTFIVTNECGIVLRVSGTEEAMEESMRRKGVFGVLQQAVKSLKTFKRDWVRTIFIASDETIERMMETMDDPNVEYTPNPYQR